MIFTSLSPNTEPDDISLAVKLLFSPWQWVTGKAGERLEQAFEKWLPGYGAVAFNAGRTGLYAILSALNLQPDDEILLQAYTCVAVPGPVLWTGAKPVYVDCTSDLTMSLEDLRRKISPRSKVLIIQHTLGIPADLENLINLAREHHLFVIEDCAHTMGSTYQGERLGTFGDAAFFSFGRDKALSSVFGGVVVSRDSELTARLKNLAQTWGTPSSGWVVQQLIHPLILNFSKATYSWLGKFVLAGARRLGIISKAVYPTEKSGHRPPFGLKTMPNALAELALHQFKKLERYNLHRQMITKIYEENLPSSLKLSGPIEKWSKTVLLRYPIRVTNSGDLILKAKQSGIELGDWYQQPIAPTGVQYEKIGFNPKDCPDAARLSQHALNLPTHIQVTPAQAGQVLEFIKKHAVPNN
ncbi:aminotransferase class I/II-fold pyridoxal phosphate-dependent enzyme [Candidatus Uhrbacteria bacterium]|nr:aminotransferase class I/II-fold pyridoxal phosphate-dependent enzyme [Candidatus Uhrbacteria bacterium]